MRVTYCNRTDNTFRGLSHVEFLLITKHVLTVVLEQTTWDVKEVSRAKYIPSTFQFIFFQKLENCCICNTCGSFLSPHIRGIQITESLIRETFACGIRNPTNDWNSGSKFY